MEWKKNTFNGELPQNFLQFCWMQILLDAIAKLLLFNLPDLLNSKNNYTVQAAGTVTPEWKRVRSR